MMISNLVEYLDSIKARDPAPRTRWEVLLYPGVWAMAFHRMAHWLYRGEMYFLARLVNHIGRGLTAIDIHPGAKIGSHFFIDHGFVVIGETAEIGDNVTMYQNVTLGGTNPTNGVAGKRHPTIESNVIVGSGAQILGPITVGERARIGAGAVVTDDVQPGATMVGQKARSTLVKAETYGKDFMPYGTPCREMYDPATQTLEILQCEIDTLRKRVAELIEERQTVTSITPDIQPAKRKAASRNGKSATKGNDAA